MRVKPVDEVTRLYKENKGLVGRCIRGIKIPEHCTLEDLEQIGRLGLIKAIQSYSPDKNIKLCTYAFYYIRGYVLREVYKNVSILSPKKINNTKGQLSYPTLVPLDIDEEDTPFIQACSKEDVSQLDAKMDYYRLKKLYDIFFRSLRPQQRKALELRYFTLNDNGDHLTYDEISEIMGISKQRVCQLVFRGHIALKRKFGRYLDVYI